MKSNPAIQAIRQAIQDIRTVAPIKAGKRLEKEVPEIVDKAIALFYSSYSPKKYKRTFDFWSGVLTGISCRVESDGFYFSVSSDYIPDHLHDSGEYIFMGAFEQGIHGTSAIAVTTPPWKIYEKEISERYEEIVNEEIDKILENIM